MDQHLKNQQVLKQKDCHIYPMHEKIPENAHMYDQLEIEPCKGSKKQRMQCLRNHKVLIAAVIFIFVCILYTSMMTAILYLKLESVRSLVIMNGNCSVSVQTSSSENGSAKIQIHQLNDLIDTFSEITKYNETNAKLADIIATLSHLRNATISTISDVQLLVKDVLTFQKEQLPVIFATLSNFENIINSIVNTNSELHLLVKGHINMLNEEFSGINVTLSHLENNSNSIV